jgi:hypothetical protein
VPVVFLIAIAVVLVGIFFAATGRGGELAYEQADHAPLDLGPVSAADVALLRPPTAMWGYNMQVTDEALDQIAKAVRERDVTIAYLQEQLASFDPDGSYSESRGAHARQAPGAFDPPAAPGGLDALDAPGAFGPAGAFDSSSFLETLFPETPGPPTIPDPLEPPTDLAAPEPSDTVDALEPQNALEPQDAPETPDASESQDATEPQVTLQPQDTLHSPEPAEPHQGPETHEPSESPEPVTAAEPPAAGAADAAATDAAATVPVPAPPQTPLVLKASGPKPERQEPTQPSPVLPDPGEEHDATEPSATTAPDDPPGPQSAFDTHGWWAEQQEAAREEQATRHAASKQDDESGATADEQGW